MISGFRCDSATCGTLFRITDEGTDQASLMEMMLSQYCTCPVCGEARLIATTRLSSPRHIALTTQQLWNAVNGRGLPDQQVTPESVASILANEKIEAVQMKPAPNGVVIIEELRFACGATLHFGVSGGQAAVYKITSEEKGKTDADH